MTKNRDVLYTMLFLVLVVFLWVGLFFLPGPEVVRLPEVAGASYDLAEFDFKNTVYVTGSAWESWPEQLYSPEELPTAEAPVPENALDYTQIQFATHRLRLALPGDDIYTVSLYSPDYSMRLYIDGVLTDTVGHPGTTKEETIPQMRDAVYYFVPHTQPVEVVVQAANFVHHIGSRAPALTFGTGENMTKYTRNVNLKIGLIFGCLITACLYHLSLFLLNRRRKASLAFSALCLLLAYISKDYFALLFPRYPWQITLRAEYIATVLAALAFMLLVHILFPAALHKWVLRGYLLLGGAFIVVILVTSTLFFTGLLTWFKVVSAGVILYGILRLALLLKERKLKNLLAFLGITVLGASVLAVFINRMQLTSSAIGGDGFVSTGMMFLVFCYALVVALEGAEADKRVEEMSRSEAEIRETNQMLERLNRAKTDFLGNISHEMKTPLAVISNCAGVTLRQIEDNSFNEDTKRNLNDMQHEAIRLGHLVNQLMELSLEKERQRILTDGDASALLNRAADYCKYLCNGRKNSIIVSVTPAYIPLRLNEDGIFQVLLNLITNANRQMWGGTISLSARVSEEESCVVMEVADSGKGIPPELLAHIFERGVSGDGRTGFGLAICKEIVEEHGGRMEIHSGNDGTAVCFTIASGKEGTADA